MSLIGRLSGTVSPDDSASRRANMIVAKNSFGAASFSSQLNPSQHRRSDAVATDGVQDRPNGSPFPDEQSPLITIDELEQILSTPHTSTTASSDHWPAAFDDDEDLFEFDLTDSPANSSDASGADFLFALSAQPPPPATGQCATSMSNYSLATNYSSPFDDGAMKQEPVSPSETTPFVGSESASCTSSTPSTPYSFMTTNTPLPSFSEIYSPRKVAFAEEQYLVDTTSEDPKTDYFSFEEYFSESNSTPSEQSPADFRPEATSFTVKQEPTASNLYVCQNAVSSSTYDVCDSKPTADSLIEFYLPAPSDPVFTQLTTSSFEPTSSTDTVFITSPVQDFSNQPNDQPQSSVPPLVPLKTTTPKVSEGLLPEKLKIRSKNRASHSQICAVCGDVAACQHYGVITCEGCKGFFKRTVQKSSKYTCMGSRDCIIDKRRRNRCQFCRFQKCLAVGMVKEVVRTDSLKGRRGRLPSKTKTSSDYAAPIPMPTIAALVRAHLDTSCDKANLDFSFYNEEIAQIAQTDVDVQSLLDSQLLRMLDTSVENNRSFVNRIPEFASLRVADQSVLIEAAALELLALRVAFRMKPASNYVVLCNNMVLHRSQFVQTFGAEWFFMIERLSNQLHALQIDLSAFACLSALTVVTNRPGLENALLVEQLENKIITALRDHTTYNAEAQLKPHYLSRVLSILPELRSIGEVGAQVVGHKRAQLADGAKSPAWTTGLDGALPLSH